MAKKPHGKSLTLLYDVLGFALGSMLLAFSVQYFCAPNKISIGGLTGLATMVNYLLNGAVEIGTLVILFNIPLFILFWIFLGREGFVKSLLGTGFSALGMNVFEWLNLTPYQNDVLLAALLGGVVGGVGIGMIFARGGNTGGVDIIARLFKLKAPYMEIGRLVLVVEGVLLICTTIVYQNIENALYSLITIYVYSYCMDVVIYGADRGKSFFIISSQPRAIAAKIIEKLHRGVTILPGIGAYTEQPVEVLMVALRTNEIMKARQIVKELDPGAFIIVNNTSETIGYGFKSIKDNK
ncbi:MAG: YitT family protein [Clostridia bacterium]|nr:YitT family protein [Clostridia bacterium]